MNNPAKPQNSTTGQKAKSMAQIFADEPSEILKTAKKQLTGEQNIVSSESNPEILENRPQENSFDVQKYASKLRDSESRSLTALESELLDIKRRKLFNDLLAKINEGQDVSVESFQELSFDEREVLKANLEAKQKADISQTRGNALLEPSTKPLRKFGAGQKQSAQKQTTRVEKPVPPSG